MSEEQSEIFSDSAKYGKWRKHQLQPEAAATGIVANDAEVV